MHRFLPVFGSLAQQVYTATARLQSTGRCKT